MTESINSLKDQIEFIDARLATIKTDIARLDVGSYQRQELLDEAGSLEGLRRVVTNRLKELAGSDPFSRVLLAADAARTESLRQARVNVIRRNCLEQAAEFERQGDHRNAKIWRLEALNARKQAEQEIH